MTHLTWEELVDYWAGEGDPNIVDEHLFACDECSELSARVAAVTETLRSEIPFVVSAATVEALRHRGLRVVDNPMQPGERKEIGFPGGVDILLHRLAIDLTGATRVQLTLHSESSGALIADETNVPFDAGSGEILVACQRHFAVFPPDTVFDVTVHGPAPVTHRYTVLHQWA